jgi:serine/threonine protein kinase
MKVMNRANLLRPHLFGEPESGCPMDDVRSEISNMSNLIHPNILRLVEAIDDPKEENLYLVLEYAEHGSLSATKPICEHQVCFAAIWLLKSCKLS